MSGLLRTVRFAIAIGELDTGRAAVEYLFVDTKRPLVIAKLRALRPTARSEMRRIADIS